MNLFEEIVAVKLAMELDFISKEDVSLCLKEFFETHPVSLLQIFIDKGFIAESQEQFLQEGVDEQYSSETFPEAIDVTDIITVEVFLGLRKEDTKSKVKVIICPNCQAKYSLKLSKKTNKFRCAKCRSYFYTSETHKRSSEDDSWAISQNAPSEVPNLFRTVTLTPNQIEASKEEYQKFLSDASKAENQNSEVTKRSSQTKEETPANLWPSESAEIKKDTEKEMPQNLWSSDQSGSQTDEEMPESLWSSESQADPPSSQTPEEDIPQSVWSSDSLKNEEEMPPNLFSPETSQPVEETPQSLWSSDSFQTEDKHNSVSSGESEKAFDMPTLGKSSDANSNAKGFDLPTLDKSSDTGSSFDLPTLNKSSDSSALDKTSEEGHSPLPNFNTQTTAGNSDIGIPNVGGGNSEGGLDIKTDFLKVPTENISEASDFLNISVTPVTQEYTAGTMELNISATSLYKGKQQKTASVETIKEAEQLTKNLSHLDGLVIVKYALNYDFISFDDANTVLDKYDDALADGQAPENMAAHMLKESLITKFQYRTLKESLEKDRQARRIPKLDMASRKDMEKYLNISETHRVMRITCPHCQTKFRARVNVKGGKFRCGKCKKNFFLSKQ